MTVRVSGCNLVEGISEENRNTLVSYLVFQGIVQFYFYVFFRGFLKCSKLNFRMIDIFFYIFFNLFFLFFVSLWGRNGFWLEIEIRN